MEPILIVIAVFVLLNIISFMMYLSDKKKAIKGKRRTPEKTLLIISFIGPFGAAAGMSYARHKTKKTKFKLVYVFMMIHIVAIALLLWYYL
jgi:Predicted membrane protein